MTTFIVGSAVCTLASIAIDHSKIYQRYLTWCDVHIRQRLSR